MRTIIIATVCALSVTLPAGAQQVEKIKARGANAAGACSGSLDMLGQYMSRAAVPDTKRLQEIERARDLFINIPRFDSSEVSAAANAFVTFMSDRIRKAKTAAEREAIQREIVTVANGCFASLKTEMRTLQQAEQSGGIVPAQPAAPVPAPAAPTYETVPAQPYTTEPLILDPVPAQ